MSIVNHDKSKQQTGRHDTYLDGEETKAQRGDVVDVVEVCLVRLLVGRLVLGHRVDERVACLCVLDKQTANASAQRSKVPLHNVGGWLGG
jgi:hypothetical protein